MSKKDKSEEQEYIDLYNKGYGVHQFSPELADMIMQSSSKGLDAVVAGIEKSQFDNEPSRTPDWLKNDRFKENQRDVIKTQEKDIEPEKD